MVNQALLYVSLPLIIITALTCFMLKMLKNVKRGTSCKINIQALMLRANIEIKMDKETDNNEQRKNE